MFLVVNRVSDRKSLRLNSEHISSYQSSDADAHASLLQLKNGTYHTVVQSVEFLDRHACRQGPVWDRPKKPAAPKKKR